MYEYCLCTLMLVAQQPCCSSGKLLLRPLLPPQLLCLPHGANLLGACLPSFGERTCPDCAASVGFTIHRTIDELDL